MESNAGREGLGDDPLAFGNQFRGKPVKRTIMSVHRHHQMIRTSLKRHVFRE
jgi:hypothetical protein